MKPYLKEKYHSGGYQVKERIYVLRHPDNNEVFYVGRTRKPLTDRLWGHISAAKGKGEKFRNSIKDDFIMNLIRSGKRPTIESVEEIIPISYIEYLEIAEREIYWMKYFWERGTSIMNIMGLKITQPNAKYLWYLDCKERGRGIPIEYYFCGKDKDGNSLYDKERIFLDGVAWEDDIEPLPPVHKYNPFNNPIWMKKVGLI